MKRIRFFSNRFSKFWNRRDGFPVWAMRHEFPCLPEIGWDQPLVDTEFWKWLNSHRAIAKSSLTIALAFFGAGYGFSIYHHFIPTNQMETYKHTFQHFVWCLYNDVYMGG